MTTEAKQSALDVEEVMVVDTACSVCGGDGKETCTNPDHGFINAMSFDYDMGAHGCPVCGTDPQHKVKNGGACEHCNGTGREPATPPTPLNP